MVVELVERGSFEAMDDLARAVPLTVVADLIGVQGAVRENMLVWGEAAFNCLGPMNERAAQSFPSAGELFQWSVECKAEDLTDGSLGRAIFDAADRGDIPHETCGMIIHQQAVLLYGAANRDPRHYEEPDVFRVERDPGDHLSFGHGPHVCAGRGLAKLEIYAVLDALARRVRRLTIGEPTRRLGNSTRSYDTLPVPEIAPA
jgi:cytochrome P450